MLSDGTLESVVYGMFFMEGMCDEGWDAVIEAWGIGAVELVRAVGGHAEALDKMVKAARASVPELEYPGVLEYEVCAPFGQWIARGLLGTGVIKHTDALRHLSQEVIEFFSQGSSAEVQLLVGAAVVEATNNLIGENRGDILLDGGN